MIRGRLVDRYADASTTSRRPDERRRRRSSRSSRAARRPRRSTRELANGAHTGRSRTSSRDQDPAVPARCRRRVAEEELGDEQLRSSTTTDLAAVHDREAQHILVTTRGRGRRRVPAVTAPDARQDFADLAKDVSTDTASGAERRQPRRHRRRAVDLRAGVRRGRGRARAGRDLRAGADAVRLARDPPRRQAGHAVRGGEGAAARAASRALRCSTRGCASSPSRSASR